MEVNINYQFDQMKNYLRDVLEYFCEGFFGRGELWYSYDFQL